MTIDPLILTRKRIGDDRKSEVEVFEVNDTVTYITLSYTNATVYSLVDASRGVVPLEEDTDYTVNTESGVVSLLYAPDETKLTIEYYYYAFTDEELNMLIDAYGTNGACAEAIRWIIADASRLHDYSRGATSESLSQIIKNLQEMLKDYGALVESDTSNMKVLKRTNDYYRGTKTYQTDLSRDDSLNL